MERSQHPWRTLILSAAMVCLTTPALTADATDMAYRLNSQAMNLYKRGRYAEAIPVAERALAILEKALGEVPDTAIVMDNLANMHLDAGDYVKAQALILRALAIFEKTIGAEAPDTATCLNNLAEVYFATGAYAKAEPLYVRALGIRKKALGPEHPDTANSMNNLASLYFATGAYHRAEQLDVSALAIREKVLGPEHPDTAFSLNNLAALYQRTGAYAKAEPLNVRALAIRERALGREHPDTLQSLNNLAALYFFTGAYAKAEPLYVRALAIREKVLGPDHPNTARSLNNLALLYHVTGAYTKAEPLYTRSLAIREKVLGPDHPNTALGLENLSILRWGMGDLTRALPLMARAREIKEVNVARLLQASTEERRRQYLATLDHDLDVSYSLIDQAPAARALGAATVLQLKGRILDATADAVARLRRNLDERGRAQLDELQRVVAQRSQLGVNGPGSLSLQTWRERLDELAREQDRLEGDLGSRNSEVQQVIQPVTLERVQRAIPIDHVLIEWIRYRVFDAKARGALQYGSAHYAAYLIVSDRPPAVVDLGEADAIERVVTKLQEQVRYPGGDVRPKEAQVLFELVVRPLLAPLAKLQPNPARLLLSPDAALNLIPFAALLDDQDHFFGQRFELSYLTSGRDLIRLQSPQAPRDGVMVVAAPAYGNAAPPLEASKRGGPQTERSTDFEHSGLSFTPLPGTLAEAKLLKQLFKLDDANVATGTDATEAWVKQLHGPSVLHVATHGFFLRDQPRRDLPSTRGVETAPLEVAPALPVGENALLRSGLALAGANARNSANGEDGILTAAEAAQLDLQGTQLVVLSACETGAGDVANGEGVYGLRRALVLAGAQSQLVSLWKVDDSATEKLMAEYYRQLAAGKGRAEALRSAQQILRQSAGTAHPYYWAAFVPIGDWRPMRGLRTP